MLGPSIEGTRFLDAYAGTGAVGMEALSRGAADVMFIEQHRAAAGLIRQNLAGLKVDSGYWILTSSVQDALEKLAGQAEQFDFIFIDPPYEDRKSVV